MNPALAEVVTIYEENASDIAAMLRQCAQSIDDGAKPKCIVAVAVEEDGSITNYGWGRVDSLEAIATLHMGAAKMVNDALAQMEDD